VAIVQAPGSNAATAGFSEHGTGDRPLEVLTFADWARAPPREPWRWSERATELL
jgi:hypothetical protein